MLRSKLSVLGIYNYRPDIFDKFKVPNGVEMDILEPELLSEVAELESLYTDPDVLKDLIGAWSRRRMYAWQKLYDTTKLDYNPIWNKDANYEETETRDLDTKTQQKSDLSSTGEATRYSYGFNSDQPQPAEKSDSKGKDTGTVNGTGSEDETIKRTRREYGNIGVTSTQQLIEAEREVADFDIYHYIITDFKQRFCLLVY